MSARVTGRAAGAMQLPGPAGSGARDRTRQVGRGEKDAAALRRRFLRRFIRDETAAVAVLAAFIFPVLIGGMGLGAETGYWYMTQRKLQHAADVAAHAAGVRNRAGDSLTEMHSVATLVASASGFLPARGTVGLFVPPTTGAFAGDPDAVEVVVTENWPRWFTALFADGQVPLSGRAVAQIQPGTGAACVLALSGTASPGVNVTGSTSVTLSGCEVASNSVVASSVNVGGSGTLSTECVTAVGGVTATAGLTVSNPDCPIPSAPAVRDPYEDVPEPDVATPCVTGSGNVGRPGTATTVPNDGVTPVHYCSGLMVKGDVTFSPGVYIISGGAFQIGGGGTTPPTISGAGVTFFITGTGDVRFNGNVNLQLSAPTTGPYSGILFYGDDDAWGVDHTINGTAGSTLQGAIYFPAGDVSISGDSAGSGGCTQIVAQTVTFIGNSTLSANCSAAGTTTIATNQPVAIVE